MLTEIYLMLIKPISIIGIDFERQKPYVKREIWKEITNVSQRMVF